MIDQNNNSKYIILAICLGLFIGLAGFTFYYGHGFSYLSNDPTVCANCHVMQRHFDDWQRSSHHTVAVCNDCHAPSSFLGKMTTKMINGFNHSWAFTFQNFHEPIMIKDFNARILNKRCQECHRELVSQMMVNAGPNNQELLCTKCHASVGHGDN